MQAYWESLFLLQAPEKKERKSGKMHQQWGLDTRNTPGHAVYPDQAAGATRPGP